MSEFNINDKVILKKYSYLGEEVGVIVGIDIREDSYKKYLVKFDSIDELDGWEYESFCNNPYYTIEPYEGYAIWFGKNELTKVKEDSEEDIKNKFNKIREQKKEAIKKMNEKMLQLTLEIKELETEVERIKKEYYL